MGFIGLILCAIVTYCVLLTEMGTNALILNLLILVCCVSLPVYAMKTQKYEQCFLIAIIGLVSVVYITFFVREKNAEELREDMIRKKMRKYVSRMICVEELPDQENSIILRLKEMSSMIALSEELREPILYCIDEKGLPLDGKFYIFGNEYTYLLHYPKPSTTFGVDRINGC